MYYYHELVDAVLKDGEVVPSRHGPTRELLNHELAMGADELPRRAGVNRAIGWSEMLQLIGGIYSPDDIARVAPKADLTLFTPQASYGPRVAGQMYEIVNQLKRDPTTRQAVATLARPEEASSSDLPCTTSLQFILRGGRLHTIASMRSWDLIKGTPYDMAMFGGITQALAYALGVAYGVVAVHAGSAHVYEADIERGLLPKPGHARFTIVPPVTRALATPTDVWRRLQGWASTSVAEYEPGFEDHVGIMFSGGQ